MVTTSIDAPPSSVWQVLTDFASWEQWNPMTLSMEGRPEAGARLRLRFVLRPGGRVYRSGARMLLVEPERQLRWGGGVPGLLWIEHWVRLTPEGSALHSTRVEHGESFQGLLAGIGLRLVGLDETPYLAMNEALHKRVLATAAGPVTSGLAP